MYVQGKFVFRNGRIYEGLFDNDHIADFPTLELGGLRTPDLSQIRTRTPLPLGEFNQLYNVYHSVIYYHSVIHYCRSFNE